jgi:hypothetical protein
MGLLRKNAYGNPVLPKDRNPPKLPTKTAQTIPFGVVDFKET